VGKRSDFKRIERDFYPTPFSAMTSLFPHLPKGTKYAEPCAGELDLVRHLDTHPRKYRCVWASDIAPKPFYDLEYNAQKCALTLTEKDVARADLIITNPPWDREILHPMIVHFSSLKPTWLLFDADWMHTVQSGPYMWMCRKIVSVGRVKWIPGSKSVGKDNCCWYFFDSYDGDTTTEFYGR